VTLMVTNSAGQDELSLDNYINAGNTLSLKAIPVDLADSCIASFTGLTLEALGADAYLWTLSDNSDDLFYIVNNTSNPAEIRIIDGAVLTKSTPVELKLTGIMGTCQSSLAVTIPLTAQANDLVKKAIPVGTAPEPPDPFPTCVQPSRPEHRFRHTLIARDSSHGAMSTATGKT